MANYLFSVDGAETASIGKHETAYVYNLDFFDTTDNVRGERGLDSRLVFNIGGNIDLNLTGYSNIINFHTVTFQSAIGDVHIIFGKDFLQTNGDIFAQSLSNGAVVLDASAASSAVYIEVHSNGFNELIGGAGNDEFLGGSGPDRFDGGAGNDLVHMSDAFQQGVIIDLAAGTGFGGVANGDTYISIESVIGTSFADQITASTTGGGTLNGADGNDVLISGAGADRLVGGGGSDAASYAASTAAVVIDLLGQTASGGYAEGDALWEIENVTGSAFADHLTGDANANVLHGGAGADTLDGGSGSDYANYQGSAAGVTIDLLSHTASGGDAQGDTLISIENLYASEHDDSLIGDNGINIIGGWLGNDTIAGNGGNDVLAGEAGDDTISGGDGNDRIVGGDGADTIHGGDGADSIDGGADDDIIFGEAGNDVIFGGSGHDDHIDGGDGNDIIGPGLGAATLIGGAGIDTACYVNAGGGVTINLATGAAPGQPEEGRLTGIEQVMGSNFGDTVTGDAGNNQLWGLGGDDILTGGIGADVLKGGAGNDTFVYTSIADSTVAPAGKDAILDFMTGDKIDLSAIDPDGNEANGNGAFTFSGNQTTGHGHEIQIVAFGNGVQGVYLYINADKAPDAIINVVSDHPLTAADFVL